jgi:hypothetical protein
MQIPWMAAKLSASVVLGFKTFQGGATQCVVREGAVAIGAHHAAVRRDRAVRTRFDMSEGARSESRLKPSYLIAPSNLR